MILLSFLSFSDFHLCELFIIFFVFDSKGDIFVIKLPYFSKFHNCIHKLFLKDHVNYLSKIFINYQNIDKRITTSVKLNFLPKVAPYF